MLVQCPYNPGHRMPKEALEKHIKKCRDRPADVEGGIISMSGKKREASVALPPAVKHARQGPGPTVSRTTSTTLAHLSSSPFESLSFHPALQRAICEVFQYTTMTKVQDMSIPLCLKGGDVVAKAKTGTGKTLAFLIPALHHALHHGHSQFIQVLVLSPTRELATQTADEARALLQFLPEHKVMTMLGGTNMRNETISFQTQVPLVLVATPGRLVDHLEKSGLAALVKSLKVLIFDEADQLLDMGFRPAIEKVLSKLPPREKRQTLLFSATFPAQLQAVTQVSLRKNHQVIDCVGAAEEASNEQVEQSMQISTLQDLFATVVAILDALVQQPHKIIVFLPTARETGLFAALLRIIDLPGTTILEIHSRKSQNQRTKISEQFRTIQQCILFSSDVSARGMDYPDVTFVLQVGAPTDRAQYLHRLGRTARAGKEGGGLLLLCDFERYFLQVLKDLPLVERSPPETAVLDEASIKVESALLQLHAQDQFIGAQTYQAWLGQHKNSIGKLKWSLADLVEWANYFATDIMMLSEVPALEPKTIGMMGLKGVPGIVAAR